MTDDPGISIDDVALLFDIAIANWARSGIGEEQHQLLLDADFRLSELPGSLLGQTHGLTITLDAGAAGHGWFIDSTPRGNSEFDVASSESELRAGAGSAAHDRMDLLTVLTQRTGQNDAILVGDAMDDSKLSPTAHLVYPNRTTFTLRMLPRVLLTDNGAAMVSDEFAEGLLSLGIVHERTCPTVPIKNGKQERLWATVEGRLMEMLDGVELTLDFLNEATQAWS